MTTGKCYVRMPGAQIGFKPNGHCGVAHPFVQLKEMGMSTPNTDPNYVRPSSRRKCSYANNWEEKRTELNCTEFFTKRQIDIFWNIAEKTEREMHLSGIDPPHPANLRIKGGKKFLGGFRQIDGNEEALRHVIKRPTLIGCSGGSPRAGYGTSLFSSLFFVIARSARRVGRCGADRPS